MVILQDALNNLDDVIGRGEAEGFFPESGRFVADDDDVRVCVARLHVLAELF